MAARAQHSLAVCNPAAASLGPAVLANVRALVTAFGWHFLGALVFMLIDGLLNAAIPHEWLARMVWEHGRFASLPFPYTTESFPQPGWPFESHMLSLAAFVALGVLVFQAVGFEATWLTYRCWGWPGYIADVKDRLHVRALWLRSARASWWIVPVVGVLDTVVAAAMGAQHRGYASVIRMVPPDIRWTMVGMALLYALLSARVIRRSVAGAVTADQVRCHSCGYLLRGLPSDICPECGAAARRTLPPPFALGRLTGWTPRVLRAFLIFLMTCILLHPVLSAPLWRHVRFLRPLLPGNNFLMVSNLGSGTPAYPLRREGAYWLQDDRGAAVLVLRRDGNRLRYELAWWPDVGDPGRRPAESIEVNRLHTHFPVGPWNAYCQFTPSGPVMFQPLMSGPSFQIRSATPDEVAALRAELQRRYEAQ